MISDMRLTDKELSLVIQWASHISSEVETGGDGLTEEGEELFKKLLKLKDTRAKDAKAWAEFSATLEY